MVLRRPEGTPGGSRQRLAAGGRADLHHPPNGRLSVPFSRSVSVGRAAAGPCLIIHRRVECLGSERRDPAGRPAAGIRARFTGADPWLESRNLLPAARHAGSGWVRARSRRCRYGWSWPLPAAGSTPHADGSLPSSGQDRGPAVSCGHERLIGWRCLGALPLGSVRDPARPGQRQRVRNG